MTSSPAQPTISLTTPNGSVPIPQVGFGVFQVPPEQTRVAVAAALDAGYRHVDTASLYANEEGVGAALAASGLAREDVFVTTKVWNDAQGHDATLASARASLDRLGLDHVDLLLVHWPCPAQDLYVETWQALRELRDAGLARVVGVSNFLPEHLERLYAASGEWPAVNQVELHPYLQQRELRAFHAEHGIVTQSWSPLSRGHGVLDEPVVTGIAARLGCTPAQVVLAWHLALGLVVLPRSVRPDRMAENLASAAVHLGDDDLAALAGLDEGRRIGPDPATFG